MTGNELQCVICSIIAATVAAFLLRYGTTPTDVYIGAVCAFSSAVTGGVVVYTRWVDPWFHPHHRGWYKDGNR